MKGTILLIEDNLVDADLIREALVELGSRYHLDTVSNGEEALDLIKSDSTKYDLILLDLNMPCMSGVELLRELRSLPTSQALLPVVILTNSHSSEDVRKAYRAGANAYLRKPLGIDRLIDHLHKTTEFWLETAMLPSQQQDSMRPLN